MKKGKRMQITGLFFVLMVVFTVLSRAAYQKGTAVVQMGKGQNMVIAHDVQAAGKVVQNQELAVTTEPDQRVTAIYVKEGERVKKGTVLFEIDRTLLEEQILRQQQEMEKQQLQAQDAASQLDVNAERRASEQAQAAENYALNTKRTGVAVSRARRDLQKAKQELEKFRKNKGGSQEENSVEAELEQVCEEKQENYIQAEQELSSLQWRIEKAVDDALEQAKWEASLSTNQKIHTQSAEEADELIEEDSDFEGVEASSMGEEFTDPFIQGQENDSTKESDLLDDFVDSITVENPAGDTADGIPEENPADEGREDLIIEEEPDQELPGDASDTSGEQEIPRRELSEAEKAQIEHRVRDQYQQELEKARDQVETAKEEKEAAELALTRYQQERLAAAGAQDKQTEEQLIDAVKAAQDQYVDASIAANEAAVTGGRGVQMAGIPDASDSSGRMNEITYEQMELALQKLERLKEADGSVRAPADGLVTKIHITTGEKTTDTTAILMADLSKGYSFTAEITKEQEKYIGTGDLVTLTGGSKKKRLENLEVSSVTQKEGDDSLYFVTVPIPEDGFDLGTAVTMEFSKKSQPYSVCVPLSALHLDEKNQPYVLAIDEYESIMGAEKKARKVTVTVLEQNETYAAVAEGTLSASQEIIVSSDKAVDDGSRVRIAQ